MNIINIKSSNNKKKNQDAVEFNIQIIFIFNKIIINFFLIINKNIKLIYILFFLNEHLF